MRTYLLPLLTLLITGAACAQSSHLDKVYRQYSTDNQLSIDPGLLLNVSFSSNKISVMHCLILDGKKSPNAAREWKDLENAVLADHFEEWFSVRKGKSKVIAWSLDGPGNLTDLDGMLVGDDNGGLFFHFRGHFTPEDKARIQAALQQQEGQ